MNHLKQKKEYYNMMLFTFCIQIVYYNIPFHGEKKDRAFAPSFQRVNHSG
jgi:hypothetical protein